MALSLLWQQVLFGYHQLFLVGIAGELYDLHAVEQRARYRIQRVGRGDEENVGEVYGDLHIVVAELVILLPVQGLQQRAGWVAPVIGAEFVYLVEDHDRVHASGLYESVHQAARHGAYIGLAVAAYLGLIVYAAEGDMRELAVHGPGNAHRYARLACARRAYKAEHGAADIRRQLAHGQELYDALFYFVEAVVVLIEQLARFGDVQRLFSTLVPGHFKTSVQIAADYASFCRAKRLA